MRGPYLPRRAYITITIGTLLLSGAFLVLSIDYANTTGVFYLARNTPIIHFTNELEALTSLLYSLPEDASVEYRGPYSCSWNQMTGKFVCEGGLEIENVSAAVTFTKDERMLYTPRTACIYFSFGAIAAIAGKAKKAMVKDVAKGIGDEAKEKVTKELIEEGAEQLVKKAKSKIKKLGEWIEENRPNWGSRVKKRLSNLKGLDPVDVILVKKFGMTRKEFKNKVLKAIKNGDTPYKNSKLLKTYFKTDDDYAEWIVQYSIINPERALGRNAARMVKGEDAGRLVYGDVYYHIRKAEEIEQGIIGDVLRWDLDFEWGVDSLDEWVALDPTKREIYTIVIDGERYIKTVPMIAAERIAYIPNELSKLRYNRDLVLWAQTAASGIAAYQSCRTDDLLWEMVDFFTGNQLLIEIDLDSADHFYDFYAGKYGAVTVDFSDGEDEIKAVKSYATNGEDMCFLRNQLSYFGGNYTTQPLKMEEGNIILSKNKETFDTMCTEEQDYYPIGVGEIAEYARKACDGVNQNFDVYVTPARLFTNSSGMLCESHFARNEEGEAQGSFDIFCYDFADIACPVDIKFDNLSINYTMKEGEIVNLNILDRVINPSLADLKESANTYWFKHTSYLLPRVTIDMPLIGDILKFVFGLFGGESPLDTLSNALNTIIPEIPMGSRSLELKEGFPQSMYYRCSISAERYRPIPSQPYHVRLVSSGCEPVLLMNWNDILTEDYKCGDGVCAGDENAANCETDCPAPVCLVPLLQDSCPGCTDICSSEGLGTSICVPFGELLPSAEGWIAIAPCTSIIGGLPVEGLCYCESGG